MRVTISPARFRFWTRCRRTLPSWVSTLSVALRSTRFNSPNTAHAESTPPDGNSANDTAGPVTTLVVTEADLVVAKTDTPDPVVAGNNITYTITVNNGGPSDAQTVVMEDMVPTGTTFVSLTLP